ncbi:MAG: serine hydrolase domain-containing protein, partial [Steroidobacteraceae bacterium]
RHTAGLTYQFFDTPVGRLYREADLRGRVRSNAEFASALAELPLAYQPGAGWNYSHATDLLGCVVEAASGRSLLEWEEQEILGPLGMADTSFWISDPRKHDRVAEAAAPDNRPFGAPLDDPRQPRVGQMGGTGMQSTALDYARFLQMLLNGGAYEGRRVLSPSTVTFMTSDHLGTEIGAGPTGYIPGPGYGFGLGFAVRRTAGEATHLGPAGMCSWAGSAGTLFWLDPRNDLLAVVLAQAPQQVNRLIPLMANMVYAALVEPEK